MSLDFSLDLQNLTLVNAEKALVPSVLLEDCANGFFTGPGIQTWIRNPSKTHQEIILENYLFESQITVSFRLDKFLETSDGWLVGKETMLLIVFKLLQCSSGQAIFLFNGESPIFLRSFDAFTWDERFANLLKLAKSRNLIDSVKMGNLPSL